MENENGKTIENYSEKRWLDKIISKIVVFITLTLYSLTIFWNKLFHQKVIKNKISYLKGNAIKRGKFRKIKKISLPMLFEHEEFIKNQLIYVYKESPVKLINLIKLEAGVSKKKFLDNLMAEIIDYSEQRVSMVSMKILSSDLNIKQKTVIMSYLVELATEEKRNYLIDFFRETFKRMGDPMKKTIEEITNQKI